MGGNLRDFRMVPKGTVALGYKRENGKNQPQKRRDHMVISSSNTKRYQFRGSHAVCWAVMIGVILCLLPIPLSAQATDADEQKAESSALASIAPDIAGLVFQPVYLAGKIVIAIGGVVAGIFTAVAGGEEETVRTILYTTWDDPWGLPDFLRGVESDPLVGSPEEYSPEE